MLVLCDVVVSAITDINLGFTRHLLDRDHIAIKLSLGVHKIEKFVG